MTTIRCGDHVRHVPTGETWVVAYVDGEWRDWPDGDAEASDCAVIALSLIEALEGIVDP